MTPKEKAEELFDKFYLIKDEVYDECRMHENEAKQCALIAVDEILQSHYGLLTGVKPSIYEYWQDIKKEIEKL